MQKLTELLEHNKAKTNSHLIGEFTALFESASVNEGTPYTIDVSGGGGSDVTVKKYGKNHKNAKLRNKFAMFFNSTKAKKFALMVYNKLGKEPIMIDGSIVIADDQSKVEKAEAMLTRAKLTYSVYVLENKVVDDLLDMADQL